LEKKKRWFTARDSAKFHTMNPWSIGNEAHESLHMKIYWEMDFAHKEEKEEEEEEEEPPQAFQ
jgi:hypothetical protein